MALINRGPKGKMKKQKIENEVTILGSVGKILSSLPNIIFNPLSGFYFGVSGLTQSEIYDLQKAPFKEWPNLWKLKKLTIEKRNKNRKWYQMILPRFLGAVLGSATGLVAALMDGVEGAYQLAVGGAGIVERLEKSGASSTLVEAAMKSGHPAGLALSAMFHSLIGGSKFIKSMHKELSQYKSLSEQFKSALNEISSFDKTESSKNSVSSRLQNETRHFQNRFQTEMSAPKIKAYPLKKQAGDSVKAMQPRVNTGEDNLRKQAGSTKSALIKTARNSRNVTRANMTNRVEALQSAVKDQDEKLRGDELRKTTGGAFAREGAFLPQKNVMQKRQGKKIDKINPKPRRPHNRSKF